MKRKIKASLIALLGLTTIAFITGCSGEQTPYETNNEENYTVSVKYDANGGTFTTNTSVIVDSYNLSEIGENGNGDVEIALLSPDNSSRGNDAFEAVNSGYFLAGWYAERTESTDSEGNATYTYGDRWDFETDRLEVDPNQEYTSETPVLTLYAAWVPLFEVEFYSYDSGEFMDSMTFNPMEVEELVVPAWDEETGAIEMYKFPENEGYTFSKAYYDAEGQQPVDTETIKHAGVVNYDNGTAQDSVMKLYVEWIEGEWYHIYNVEQFVDNASMTGNYEIHADLDFTDEIWPTSFMYGNFSGVINGNGHTMKNIKFAQTNNSKVNAGLFGSLTDTANISDITFKNVEFTIEAGTRVAGTSYGLFTGTLSNAATLKNVKVINSSLNIDTSCYFGVDDYTIGLVCGTGNADAVKKADIDCNVVGENPESLVLTVDGNVVTIEEVTE